MLFRMTMTMTMGMSMGMTTTGKALRGLVVLTLAFASLALVHAAPQPQATGTILLPQFEPLPAGENPSDVTAMPSGTAWAQPIGTAADGSETTAIVEEVETTVGLVLDSSGGTVVSTAVVTAIETVVVSASGWAQSNFPTTTAATATQLGGAIHCFYTDSNSGECDEVEVLPGGVTSSRVLTGSAITEAFAISTGTLPSAASSSASATSASGSQSGSASASATSPSTTPSSGAQPAPASSSSNAAAAKVVVGKMNLAFTSGIVGAVISGMVFGGWVVL